MWNAGGILSSICFMQWMENLLIRTLFHTGYNIFILNYFALISYLPFKQIRQSFSYKCAHLLSLFLPREDLKECVIRCLHYNPNSFIRGWVLMLLVFAGLKNEVSEWELLVLQHKICCSRSIFQRMCLSEVRLFNSKMWHHSLGKNYLWKMWTATLLWYTRMGQYEEVRYKCNWELGIRKGIIDIRKINEICKMKLKWDLLCWHNCCFNDVQTVDTAT